MTVQCEDGRDEVGHCPHSSPACSGWVAAHYKCYRMFTAGKISFHKARDTCRANGLHLASVKSEKEVGGAIALLRHWKTAAVFGLTCGFHSHHELYSYSLTWSDKTVVYTARHLGYFSGSGTINSFRVSHLRNKLDVKRANKRRVLFFVCEKLMEHKNEITSRPVEFLLDKTSSLDFRRTKQSLVTCADGHLTHAFLACDQKSRCGQTVCYFVRETRNTVEVISAVQRYVDTVAMYSCSSDDTEVSYSLLCDFTPDCVDKSDESFCSHAFCTEFTCANGPCVPISKRCDKYADCPDGSDEQNCFKEKVCRPFPGNTKKNLSYIIGFLSKGRITREEIDNTDPCPSSHYRCTKEEFYCLPVYTRCNGFFDCIFQEDERDCESWTCPGLYRCWGSTVCVLADHMCDGFPHCPGHDDEWLCDMTCPSHCLCQGHAFLCLQRFTAHLFPQLRYLDGRGSGMTPSDLKNNPYIVRLSLARCSVSVLSGLTFPNLQFMDLRHNEINYIRINVFADLQNLQILILKGNPLTSVTTSPSNMRLTLLKKIDLSETQLSVFDDKVFSFAPGLQFINISYCNTHFNKTSFAQRFPFLRELDIRGIIINGFLSDLLSGLSFLDSVLSSDYRLCCEKILPNITPKPACLAPQHYLSSCEDMLQSEVYRLNFWFVAVLATVANLVCFVCHCVESCVPIPYEGPVVVFMASLQCADLCMGIYASVIAAAHKAFSGQYVYHEDGWKESPACKMAGFLSLLSSEVSNLIILFLSLDHLCNLILPLTIYKFSRRSAAVACGVTWLLGIVLASIPLLPGLSHWGHYGQTAVCTAMLHEWPHVSREHLFLHTILTLNLFIYFVVCVTQVIIYRATPRYRLLINSSENPGSASVDMVMRVAVTNVAGWLSVTAVSVLTLADVTGTATNVFMVIMVLPLNPAVNPLLCLWHAVAYKRRRKQEERLLRLLRSRRKCLFNKTAAMK